MKQAILLIVYAVLFVGCHNHSHSHEGHNHSEHEIHNHEHEEHKHNEHDAHEHGEHSDSSDEIVISPQKAEQLGIISEEIIAKDFVECIHSFGTIETSSNGEIKLVAKSSGIIHWIDGKPSIGTKLLKDKVLATLSTKNLVEKDSETSAHNKFELAKKQYQRALELRKEKIISEKEFLEIEAEYLNAQNAAKNLSDGAVIILSPSDAIIQDVFKNEGEYCSEGETIANLLVGNRAILKAYLPQNQRNAKISKVDFIIDDIIYSSNSLLSISNTLQGSYLSLYFDFINKDNLPINSYAEVYLYTKTKCNTISVPLTALCEESGDYFVYIQLDEDCYAKHKVVLGSKNASEVEILKGVNQGDRVVVNGAFQVKLSKAAVIPGHTHNH